MSQETALLHNDIPRYHACSNSASYNLLRASTGLPEDIFDWYGITLLIRYRMKNKFITKLLPFICVIRISDVSFLAPLTMNILFLQAFGYMELDTLYFVSICFVLFLIPLLWVKRESKMARIHIRQRICVEKIFFWISFLSSILGVLFFVRPKDVFEIPILLNNILLFLKHLFSFLSEQIKSSEKYQKLFKGMEKSVDGQSEIDSYHSTIPIVCILVFLFWPFSFWFACVLRT